MQEEEDENMGDVDLFSLTADKQSLTVNPKWLQHLQERLLGEDGHPSKAKPDQDPNRMGLVLEWVYGSIVSTAEKAREAAKRPLGLRVPTASTAHEALVKALDDQRHWEDRAKTSKALLNRMLKSRLESDKLGKLYDLGPQPRNEAGEVLPPEEATLPDEVIVKMLGREVLLTEAKLHVLNYEHTLAERTLRSANAQIRQVGLGLRWYPNPARSAG